MRFWEGGLLESKVLDEEWMGNDGEEEGGSTVEVEECCF